MSCLNCNYRGVGNPRTIRELRDLIRRSKPKIVFLMEVMTNMEKMEWLKRQLHFEGLFFVKGHNRGGGVALLRKDVGMSRLLSYSRNHIDVEIQLQNLPKWQFIGFYGFPERHHRHEAWQLLRSLHRRSTLPWSSMGDFNDILVQTEKIGRASQPHALIKGLRESVDDYGLTEIRMVGYQFT